jgi:hypothetical protein
LHAIVLEKLGRNNGCFRMPARSQLRARQVRG